MNIKSLLEPLIAVGVVIGMIFGALNYLAKADDLQAVKGDVQLVEMRLDQKIVSDSVSQIQQRIWVLEDRNKGKPCADWKNADEKAEYRKLQEQLKGLEQKQKIMMEKIK